MEKARLKKALDRAVELVSEYPEHVQGSLASAVFMVEIGETSTAESPGADERTPPPAQINHSFPATLGEFLAELGELPHPDRIAAIAAFRFQSASVEALTADELRAAYAEVRASKPQNLSANIAKCMGRGWLVQSSLKDGKKAWRITQKGLEQVREWLTSA